MTRQVGLGLGLVFFLMACLSVNGCSRPDIARADLLVECTLSVLGTHRIDSLKTYVLDSRGSGGHRPYWLVKWPSEKVEEALSTGYTEHSVLMEDLKIGDYSLALFVYPPDNPNPLPDAAAYITTFEVLPETLNVAHLDGIIGISPLYKQ